MSNNKQIIAAFDFDGTITYRDSLLPFIFFTQGILRTFLGFIKLSPILIGYVLKLKKRQETKEAILSHFFGGKTNQSLLQMGEAFAKGPLKSKIKPEALKKISWHLNQGHRCILISASINNYVLPWAKTAGFRDVISSSLDVLPDGTVTGKLKGLNCWGPEKTRRLLELIGSKETFTLYAYGDSRGDQDLLELADFPFFKKFSEGESCACH